MRMLSWLRPSLEPQPIKLCEDCRHHISSDIGAGWDQCRIEEPLNRREGSVYHLIRRTYGGPLYGYCDNARSNTVGTCGKDGKNWEPLPAPQDGKE